jgi:hypothetical protein
MGREVERVFDPLISPVPPLKPDLVPRWLPRSLDIVCNSISLNRKECVVNRSKLTNSLVLAAVAGATFVLARALGYLALQALDEWTKGQWPEPGIQDHAAVPVIVTTDGRGSGDGQ